MKTTQLNYEDDDYISITMASDNRELLVNAMFIFVMNFALWGSILFVAFHKGKTAVVPLAIGISLLLTTIISLSFKYRKIIEVTTTHIYIKSNGPLRWKYEKEIFLKEIDSWNAVLNNEKSRFILKSDSYQLHIKNLTERDCQQLEDFLTKAIEEIV